MNGPPKVVLKTRSAPGPIPAKKGIYSSKIINKMPPTMHKAYFHHTLKKALAPDSFVPGNIAIFCI